MSTRGITVLKFVGTVTLGLLTGASYALSTFVVPPFAYLPTASSHALASLTASSRRHLGVLAGLTSAAFLTAYALSPRYARHPYLLYAGLASLASSFSTTLAPLVPEPVFRYGLASAASSSRKQQHKKPAADATSRRPLDQSYEVLDDAHSDLDVDAVTTSSGAEGEDEQQPQQHQKQSRAGEPLPVDVLRRGALVQTTLAGAGFVMAVIGIWGDGVAQHLLRPTAETIVFEL